MKQSPFDPGAYTLKTYEVYGRLVRCRAWLGLSYCQNPQNEIQVLHLFAPEALFEGETPHGYTLQTAPIFIPNTVGGYLPGVPEEPGVNPHTGKPNALFEALCHGYVAVSPGIRGRTTGKQTTEWFVGGTLPV